MNNYYVYIHRRKDNNEVFYVGISRQEKYFRINTKTGRNQIWNNIVNKYGFIGEVLYSNLSKEYACLIEKALIKSYGRINTNTGVLANLTAGGDGSVDCPKSFETKNKMSKARVGKPLSEDIKNKMSATRKGKKATNETKAKLSIIAKNKFSKKIINTENKTIYNSISECALNLNISRTYLNKLLKNGKENKYNLTYYTTVEHSTNVHKNARLPPFWQHYVGG